MDNQKNKTDHDHEFNGKKDRNFYQKPFDEVTDPLPQIDEQSASLAEKTDSPHEGEGESRETYEQGDASESTSEINEEDVRDQGDSTRQWDAEHNRSSRQR